MLAAGRLRHRVTIQKQTKMRTDTGSVVVIWEDVHKDIAASIEPLSAREFVASEAFQSKVIARITIRYVENINATMRILHRQKIYNIAGILADKMSGIEYITIPVSEGVNDG